MNPFIGIVLGSASDAEMAKKISSILTELGISHEITIASAHRTPHDVMQYCKNAESRGLKVLIAVAGLSAALPGVMAAHSLLPVVGLPVKSGALAGLDALFSVAMMPPGVPVASVGIDGAVNAALLAARIVALGDDTVKERLQQYTQQAAEKVRKSRANLEGLPHAPQESME